MIEVKGISKTYANGTRALKGVSFRLDKKITSIIGQNGAGKTTLLRILSTQLLPTSGTARINNYNVVSDSSAVRENTVSIPQEIKPLDWFSAMDLVRIYLGARGMDTRRARASAERALKKVGLWESRNKLSVELSGGMKRKIFVAMALGSDADVVFLDEPTTGLDPVSRIQIWGAIKAMRGQVVVTTHYMEEADLLCDRLAIIDHGKIVALDTPADLKKKIGGDVVRLKVAKPNLPRLRRLKYVKKIKSEDGHIVLTVSSADRHLQEILNAAGEVENVESRSPTLNDVFLHFTGTDIRDTEAEGGWFERSMNTRGR